MKKLITYVSLSRDKLIKLLIMRTIFLFMLFCAINVSAITYAQTQKLNLNVQDASFKEVVDQLEKQSEFYFFYKSEDIPVGKKITANLKGTSIAHIMNLLLEGTNLKYRIIDKYIAIANKSFIDDAQQKQLKITGKVTDKNGLPIVGATVSVPGTSRAVITDENGMYVLPVNANDKTISFSFIGMKKQNIIISGRTIINIELDTEARTLDEVVVVGYGTLKKRDLTGAISSVKMDRLENEKPQAVQDLLRGNIAGLDVGLSTSAKGGGSLDIRGLNNLRGATTPLLVLDGVIYQGGMEDINPNDVQTIDVLKDASSCAVYGAKAANGVVLITTKKGKLGKPVINFSSSIGLATMAANENLYDPQGFINWRTDVLKSMNYYNTAMNTKLYEFDNPLKLPNGVTETMWRDGKTGDLTDIWLSRIGLLPIEIANYKAGKTVDWAKMVFQNGLRQDHNISLSGKKDEVTYYASLGYNKNEGIIVGDEYTAVRGRLNLDANITNWLSVGLHTQFANRDESNVNANWGIIVNDSPFGSIYKDDGVTIRESPVDDLGRQAKNPLYDRMFTDQLKTYNTLTNSLYANVKLPFGISLQTNFAPRFQWYNYLYHQSALHDEWAKFGGSATREQSSEYSWQVDNLLKWNRTFNKIHQFDVTFLVNAEKYQSWDNTMYTDGFTPTDALGFHNMSAGTSTSNVISSNDSYSTGNALMGRVFYSLLNRYMVTLSMRRDGYSAFGANNKYGNFPSAALAWVFTDESFLKNDILTYAKLRASWGINGNRDIGIYNALSDMTIGKYPYQTTGGTAYQSNQLYVNRMSNPNMKWERTKSLNFGLDFNILNGLFDGSIEYYKKNTYDLLISRGLPSFTGFSTVTSNMGEVQNTGFELTLNANVIDNEDFKWRISGNFYLNRNKIVHLYGDMVNVTDASGNVTGQKEADDLANKWFIGHAIDQIWEPQIIGVWQVGQEAEAKKYGLYPGDFRLKDVNNDGKINQLDYVFQGYTSPRFRWNMRQEFTFFKNFNASFSIYSYLNYYGSDNQAKNKGGSGFPDRTNSYVTKYWTPENPTNNYARIYSSEGGVVYNVWRNKSFVRLDDISISYSVPASILSKVKINSLKIIGTVHNAAVYTPHWEFYDPENSGPNPRYFTLGVNMNL